MVTLSALPAETIGLILSHLQGSSVLCLCQLSGNVLFAQKAYQGTRSLSFSFSHSAQLRVRWPKGLERFFNMESLTLAYSTRTHVMGITHQQLLALPRSLKSLEWKFENAIDCWLPLKLSNVPLSKTSPDSLLEVSNQESLHLSLVLLRDVLPNLTRLSLHGDQHHTHAPTASDPLRLPPWGKPLYTRFLSNLPLGLTFLSIDFGVGGKIGRLFDILPPCLAGANSSAFSIVSPSSFTIEGDPEVACPSDTSDGCAHSSPAVPSFSTLESRLVTIIMHITVVRVDWLPRTLRTLWVSKISDQEALARMPLGLTSLSISQEFSFQASDFSEYPRSLSHLSLFRADGWNGTNGLPSGIQSLSLTANYIADSGLPVNHPFDLSTLPNGLTELELSLVDDIKDEDVVHFPRSLTCLKLGPCCRSLSLDALKKLPKGLKTLYTAYSAEITSFLQNIQLPNLENLHCPQISICDHELSLLPQNLKSCRFSMINVTGSKLGVEHGEKLDEISIERYIRSLLPPKCASSIILGNSDSSFSMSDSTPYCITLNDIGSSKAEVKELVFHRFALEWMYGLSHLIKSTPHLTKFICTTSYLSLEDISISDWPQGMLDIEFTADLPVGFPNVSFSSPDLQSPSLLTIFPSTLTRLALHATAIQDSDALPRTLVHLRALSCPLRLLTNIPGLKSLDLLTATNNTTSSNTSNRLIVDFSLLPPSLTSLCFRTSQNIFVSSFSSSQQKPLPPNLKALFLPNCNWSFQDLKKRIALSTNNSINRLHIGTVSIADASECIESFIAHITERSGSLNRLTDRILLRSWVRCTAPQLHLTFESDLKFSMLLDDDILAAQPSSAAPEESSYEASSNGMFDDFPQALVSRFKNKNEWSKRDFWSQFGSKEADVVTVTYRDEDMKRLQTGVQGLLDSIILSANGPLSRFGLAKLPPTLTKLHIVGDGSYNAAGKAISEPKFGAHDLPRVLPRTLLDLRISGRSWSTLSVQALPRGLRTLIVEGVTKWSTKRSESLPASLTDFHLLCPSLADHCLEGLPRSLTRLAIPFSSYITFQAISLLPPSLSELITISQEIRSSHAALVPPHIRFIGGTYFRDVTSELEHIVRA